MVLQAGTLPFKLGSHLNLVAIKEVTLKKKTVTFYFKCQVSCQSGVASQSMQGVLLMEQKLLFPTYAAQTN